MRHNFRKVKHHISRVKTRYKYISLGILLVLTIPLTIYLLQKEQDARTLAQIEQAAFNEAKVFSFSNISYARPTNRKKLVAQTTPAVQIVIADENTLKQYLQENKFFAPHAIALEENKSVPVKNVSFRLVNDPQLYYPDVRYPKQKMNVHTHNIMLSSFNHIYNPIDQTLVIKFYIGNELLGELSDEKLSEYANQRMAEYIYFLGNRPITEQFTTQEVREDKIVQLFEVKRK